MEWSRMAHCFASFKPAPTLFRQMISLVENVIAQAGVKEGVVVGASGTRGGLTRRTWDGPFGASQAHDGHIERERVAHARTSGVRMISYGLPQTRRRRNALVGLR